MSKNNLYEINKTDNRRNIFYSALSAFLVLCVGFTLYFFVFRQSKNTPSDNSIEESINESSNDISNTEESSEDINEESSEISIDESIDESSVIEESSQPPVENQYKDHQWVINEMGYTYLYYDKGLEEFVYSTKAINDFTRVINDLYKKINSEKFYNIIVPTQAGFIDFPVEVTSYNGDKFNAGSQKTYIQKVAEGLDQSIINIDLFDLYKEKYDNEEYIFFNTDTNYTALGAFYTYKTFAETAGFTPMNRDLLAPLTFTGFLGQFYNATRADRLFDNADTIYYYNIDESYPSNVTFYKSGLVYKNRSLIYKDAAPANGYYVFLGTNASRFEITTGVDTGKSILVIGDTSASAFVPYLVSEYTKITYINPEYFTEDFNEILENTQYDETLLISYSTTYNKNYYLNYIKKLLGD